ncbi:MAG: phosphate/phosphite/phosphonate ABC transporter substrate-binding protein [Candidatus Cloacimonadota bacterium]|nr:phosphate/phosphite/phosphonate ABC transporter substrate-binding protein [Candidatus Cloacimonadota bacterium]
MIFRKYFTVFFILLFFFSGCAKKGSLGSESNPIKMYFVPSMEAGKVLSDGQKIAELLFEETGYYFDVAVPTSYAAVIEAMGTEEADIAWFATFAYILANEKYGAQVGLTTIRGSESRYRGQFVARDNSEIQTLQDIDGKIIAYTDAASTSGYIYPSATLKKNGIEPGRTFFSGGHPQSIIAVYKGTADVGCTFWSPSDDEESNDARISVLETYPDVLNKVKIIGFTDWIPNDTVTFRRNFPPEMKNKIISSLMEMSKQGKGQRILKDLYDIDGFVKSSNSDYDIVRETLESLNVNAQQFVK